MSPVRAYRLDVASHLGRSRWFENRASPKSPFNRLLLHRSCVPRRWPVAWYRLSRRRATTAPPCHLAGSCASPVGAYRRIRPDVHDGRIRLRRAGLDGALQSRGFSYFTGQGVPQDNGWSGGFSLSRRTGQCRRTFNLGLIRQRQGVGDLEDPVVPPRRTGQRQQPVQPRVCKSPVMRPQDGGAEPAAFCLAVLQGNSRGSSQLRLTAFQRSGRTRIDSEAIRIGTVSGGLRWQLQARGCIQRTGRAVPRRR